MASQNTPLEKKRFIFFNTGLIAALALALVAFQWTSVDYGKKSYTFTDLQAKSIEEIVPLPPVPKPPVKVNTSTMVSHQVNIKDVLKGEPEKTVKFLVIPDLGDIGSDEGDEWYEPEGDIDFGSNTFDPSKVQRAARYSECESPSNTLMELQCTRNQMIQYVQQLAKYPRLENEAGMDGYATISFVISRTGEVVNAEVKKASTKGFGQAALAAVEKLPQMLPAEQFDQPVAVEFEIPVRFTHKVD